MVFRYNKKYFKIIFLIICHLIMLSYDYIHYNLLETKLFALINFREMNGIKT